MLQPITTMEPPATSAPPDSPAWHPGPTTASTQLSGHVKDGRQHYPNGPTEWENDHDPICTPPKPDSPRFLPPDDNMPRQIRFPQQVKITKQPADLRQYRSQRVNQLWS